MKGTLPRFLTVGVANTTVGFAVIVLARETLGFGHLTANAIGYAAGLLVGFTLNRAWTFRHTGSASAALWRFLLVFAVAYLANLAIVSATIEPWSRWPYTSHLAGMIAYTLIFYAGSRSFAFRNSTP